MLQTPMGLSGGLPLTQNTTGSPSDQAGPLVGPPTFLTHGAASSEVGQPDMPAQQAQALQPPAPLVDMPNPLGVVAAQTPPLEAPPAAPADISASVVQASQLLAQIPAQTFGIRRQESNTDLAQAIRTAQAPIADALQYIPADHQRIIADAFDVLGQLAAPSNRYSINSQLTLAQRRDAGDGVEAARAQIVNEYRNQPPVTDPREKLAKVARITHEIYANNGLRLHFCDDSARLLYHELTTRGMPPDHLIEVSGDGSFHRSHALIAYTPLATQSFAADPRYPIVTLDGWMNRNEKMVLIKSHEEMLAHLRSAFNAVMPVLDVSPVRMKFV